MKPGDEFTEAWVKRGEELRAKLTHPGLNAAEAEEYRALQQRAAEALRTPPERADDPRTLFTDESRRPQLNGIDWNDFNNAMCRDEVLNFVKMLGARFGVPLAEAALQVGIAALRR